MSFTETQIAELVAPLDSKNIKPPKQYGPKGDYLEAWHVINEANRIFGFDGWSYTIDLRQDSLVEGADKDGKPQWQAAYTCVCTLTAGDATRQDVGFGSGFSKAIGDAIEGATKEAATDSLKRALRTFGNVFGLALYDKSRANVAELHPERSDTFNLLIDGLKRIQQPSGLKPWLDEQKALRATLLEPEAIAFNAAYTTHKAHITTVAIANS